MKKIKLSALALVVACVLTACGGGGGEQKVQTPDGTIINLSNSPKGYITANTVNGIFRGQNNNHSFYGVWRQDDKSSFGLHYQESSNEKTTIPSAGKAVYKGDAVWLSGGAASFQKGGDTTINVDFTNKTVDGSIRFSVLNGDEFRRNITLKETALIGDSFKGDASVAFNSGGVYEGKLYGENAKEVAGKVQFSKGLS